MLEDGSCSSLETYNIIRVKFDHEQPKVFVVKKNEVKTLVFDLICLHR